MGFCGITLLHHEGLDKSQNGLHICVLSPVSSDVGISLCAVYPQKTASRHLLFVHSIHN